MKMRVFLTPLLGLLTLLGVVAFFNWQSKTQNVFEEMYSYLKKRPNTVLASNLGGRVTYRNFREPSFDENLYVYSAINKGGENTYLPRQMTSFNLHINKKYISESLFISYHYQISETLYIIVNFNYSTEEKELTEDIHVYGGSQADLDNWLAEQGMAYNELEARTKTLLGQSLIKAWEKSHASRFSRKDWGDVAIKSDLFFEDS